MIKFNYDFFFQYEEILTLLREVTRQDMNFSNYYYITNFLNKFHKQNLLGHLACNRQTIPIAYGFRKTASAKVEVYPGDGSIVINSKSLLEYFPRLEDRQQVLYPLNLTHSTGKYDVIARVSGGGSTGTLNYFNFTKKIIVLSFRSSRSNSSWN